MKNNYYAGVFGWLFIGLFITAISGYIVTNMPSLLNWIFSTSGYIILFLAQIIIAVLLSARIHKMNFNTAKILYILYTVLTGCSFSIIFLLFRLDSILIVLFITSLLFGIFALIGKTTSVDLSKFGIYLLIALLAVIVLEVVNLFVMNGSLNMITCIIAIIVFLGYIAFDIQRIKKIDEAGYGNDNLAIFGAFDLYLDFINIFLHLLSLFAKER